jgi:hypothetical protein
MKLNYRFLSALLLALFLLALLGFTVRAAVGYEVAWSVFGGGTSQVSGGDFTLQGTLGQSATGLPSAGSQQVTSGFWATIWSVFRVLIPVILR